MAKMYPNITGRVGLDAAFHHIQQGLLDGLSWLDDAFGRTERRERDFNGRERRVQCVYKGVGAPKNDYLELSPDSEIGNYSFFVLRDPTTIVNRNNIQRRVKQPVSLVFWFNFDRITGNYEGRNIEAVKLHIMQVLKGCAFSGGRLVVNRIYEDSRNVWKDLAEVSDLAMYHPFAGLRFDGELTYLEPCVTF